MAHIPTIGQVEKLTTNLERFDIMINGDETAEVFTDSGIRPSITKAVHDFLLDKSDEIDQVTIDASNARDQAEIFAQQALASSTASAGSATAAQTARVGAETAAASVTTQVNQAITAAAASAASAVSSAGSASTALAAADSITGTVASAIQQHINATDPHGDRAFANQVVSQLSNQVDIEFDGVQSQIDSITQYIGIGTTITKLPFITAAGLTVAIALSALIPPTVPFVFSTGVTGSVQVKNFMLRNASVVELPLVTFAGGTTITAESIGLGHVNDTPDSNKPVSGPQQIAFNLKADLISPQLTGTPTVPLAAASSNSNQIASTAFVKQVMTSASFKFVKSDGTETTIPIGFS